MKEIAIIQHVNWEGPGLFLQDAARLCQIKLTIFHAWQEAFPIPEDYDGFVLLGGGPNVNEEGKYPFLTLEKKWLTEIISNNKPCLGICLGHQLLAQALGATIGHNLCNSVGIITGLLTSHGKKHPVFSKLTESIPLFKWHGQAIQTPVPPNFEILATSTECQVEAFSIKGRPHLIGIQFDNHASHHTDINNWCINDQSWLQNLKITNQKQDQIIATAKKAQGTLNRDFSLLFSHFVTML